MRKLATDPNAEGLEVRSESGFAKAYRRKEDAGRVGTTDAFSHSLGAGET
jgi:hypothetical protein